jgi:hypothetical protein
MVYLSQFMCNVFKVEETSTVYVTELLTFERPCWHMQIHMKKRKILYIFM